jgi:hypothetical protein
MLHHLCLSLWQLPFLLVRDSCFGAGNHSLQKPDAKHSFYSFFIYTVTVDGAMLASKDFGFMLAQGLATMMMQLVLLRTWCSNLSDIFTTFTLRLGSYALISLIRAALGYGNLGRALGNNQTEEPKDANASLVG